MNLRIVTASALTVSALVLIAGCGSTTNIGSAYNAKPAATKAATTTGGDTITIASFAFSDASVKPGATVTVKNTDSVGHTINVNGTKVDLNLDGGASGTFTAPATPGTYQLTCDFHKSMRGTLIVAP
jgi:plastocyanin